MAGERELRSAGFISPYDYLRSLPGSYMDAYGLLQVVPFSMLQMGVMQGLADGLSRREIGNTIGCNATIVSYTLSDLRLWTGPARKGFSLRRQAFVFAIEHDLIDLSLVKPHYGGSLEVLEIKLIRLISEGANNLRIMQAIGMMGNYDPEEFNKKQGAFRGFMKVLLDKLGLENEFQLIALGITARRKSEETQ